MMIRKSAMSVMGYAIVLVIILGIVMIISAPMMMDKYKKDKNSSNKNYSQEDDYSARHDRDDRENIDDKNDYNSQDDVSRRLRVMEDTLNARLDSIEARQAQRPATTQSVSHKYVCDIEGNVDSDGNVIPIDNMSMDEVNKRKVVFVCEYRN